ncbi:AfsR/SARP family transcriptional regulator [Nocardiopsis sp. NPDC050513]|uniref:AfsR/SARP family transcriptional regulator n=1 Tax=Nocardiopsis sp. NPDC050513 TaxID=3364338 RepID=UPI00379FA75D
MVELDVLGTVELRVGGRPLELAGRARDLAVALGVEPGHPVDRDTLIQRVWDGEFVERSTLDATLTRLRNRLRTVGAAPAALRSKAGVYRFQILPEAVDWQRFLRLRDQADRARRAGDDPEAHVRARAALDLWRGPPLPGLTSRWASSLRHTMQTRHQSVVELWARTGLATGAHGVVDALADYVHAYPANEALAELLMRSLHASGRPGDAVEVYERLRGHLEEHEAVPRSSTERTLRLVLGAEPTGPSQPDLAHVAPLPRRQYNTLPRDLPDFTGRAREIEGLVASVTTHPPGATGVHVIHGLTGIGKSTLAVRVAALLSGHFPDGRFHVELHGRGEPHPRKAPTEALRELLSMLGVHQAQQPSSEAELMALWRDHTARARILVVLDDAADIAQVRPLIPGGPDCAVLITSRWGLSELDGARRLRLSWLSDEEGTALLLSVLERHESSEAIEGIARFCGGHPLAIRLAGGRLRSRSAWSPEDLLARLGDVCEGLDHIRSGDRSLESVFQVSTRDLDPPVRQALLRLALHPGDRFDAHAAAALVGVSARGAEAVLERLLEASLIEEPRAGQFAMHRLLSAFARRSPDLSAGQRHGALHCLFTYYLHACDLADRRYAPDRYRRPLADAPCDLPPMRSLWEAYQWWDGAQQCVLDALAWARSHGGHEAAEADIAHACAALLDASVGWEDAAAVHARAAHVRGHRDPHGAAHALYDLGQAQWRLGLLPKAYASVTEAHRLWSLIGDAKGSAITLNELGTIRYVQGRFTESERLHREAFGMAEGEGNRAGMADALNGIGNCARETGRMRESVPPFLEALEYYGQIDNWRGIARTMGDLAGSYCYLGHFQEATRLEERVRDVFRSAGDQRQVAGATINLGEIAHAQGDHGGALRHARSALATFHTIGDPEGVVVALGNIGAALVRLGRAGDATAPLEEALARSEQRLSARRYELLLTLGHAHAMAGDGARAMARYEESEAEAARVGTVRGRALALLAWERLARARGDDAKAEELRRGYRPLSHLLDQEEITAYAAELDFLQHSSH